METSSYQYGVDLKRGSVLGNYSLLEYIGGGGEAQIWSAWDERREKIVALKVVSMLGQTIDPESRAVLEFKHKIDLIGGLDHPNILPVFDPSFTQHHIYCGMRYICNGSLADRLLAGSFSLADTMQITSQIVSALTYLHKHGIVHRDIKPSNILVDSQDRIYLTDFGLAKLLIQETMPLHTGRGTGPYAPFEQYALAEVTPQSDIYSLGILIYEMLTGRLPWDGQMSLAKRQKDTNDVLPDPRDLKPDLPKSISDALRQMTAFIWIERPATAAEAFELLLEAVSDETDKYSLEIAAQQKMVETSLDKIDARSLLHNFLSRWEGERQEFPARLTHLAFIDVNIRKEIERGRPADPELCSFMLRGAFAHAYSLEYWWQAVEDPHERLQVCFQALENEDQATINRVLDMMVGNPEVLRQDGGLPQHGRERLVDLAVSGQDSGLRRNALEALQIATQGATRWQTAGENHALGEQLAKLVLGDPDLSDQAAGLIGKQGHTSAVRILLDSEMDQERLVEVLDTIRQTAGSLPGDVPFELKRKVTGLAIRRQFADDTNIFSLPRLLIGLILGSLISILMLFGAFSSADAHMRDAMLSPFPVSNIVTIVEVNDATLERYGRWDSWPRRLHAELIDRLLQDGARAIVFDIIFASKTSDDDLLAQAMRRGDNVVQPVMGQGDAYQDVEGTFRFDSRLLPTANLLAASKAIGHTNVVHDADGYVRRMPTTIQVSDGRYPSLALAALEVYLGLERQIGRFPEPVNGRLDFAGRRIPVGKNGEMLINFAGTPAQAEGSAYQRMSYQSIIDHDEDPALIKDKIILIGITATAGPDVYLTPVSQGRPMTGIEILANTIETIWSGRFIRRPTQIVRMVILIALGALIGILSKQPGRGLLLVGIVALVYFIAANALFDSQGVLLDILYPFLTILISFIGAMGYRFSITRRA